MCLILYFCNACGYSVLLVLVVYIIIFTGHGRRGGSQHCKEIKCKQANLGTDVNESSPIIQQFLAYQKVLDAKHDKHERLVKLSRDVTIESKRTIFLLQRITGYFI